MTSKTRFRLLSCLLLFLLGGLAWRVITLQIVEQRFLRSQGDARVMRIASIPAYRGMITDRNGEPLAISTPVESVWVNPKEFDCEHTQLLSLAAILDLSLEQILEKVKQNSLREFVYLQRHVSPIVAEQIVLLGLPGVYLKSEYRRYYPAGEVTAQVLGFTDLDDHGQEGLELAYEQWLQGIAGAKRVIRDRKGREVQVLEGLKAMHSGKDVVLSLDQRLQYLAYRELKAAVSAHKAEAGAAVVLDVATGEVLAMVNQPSFNPNVRLKMCTDGRYRNRAVTDVFEPGSVIKTFSVTNALHHGLVTPTSMVDTSPGWMTVGKNIVKEDKHRNYGLIDVATILKKSSNVGVTKLTLSLPSQNLYDLYSKLGFGNVTGSGFPGESAGALSSSIKSGSFVLATLSFGYGMSVTPLQLAQAYAVLGAGGVKHPVTFLKQEGATKDIPGETIVDSAVARQIVDMLMAVVEQGTGTQAKVMGYCMAGKSGTARKISQGVYQKDSHVAVFAGVAPALNPRFAIVVMVDDPKAEKGVYYGGQVAAPVFSKIAAGALRIFNVPPDIRDSEELRVAQHGD